MQITPKSLTINQLLGAASEQYVIPSYQRRYSWREKQLAELFDDIDLLGDADTHLLGSIVCLMSHHTAGLNKLEVVDGQQRLTSLCILLNCIKEKLAGEGNATDSHDLGRLLQSKALNSKPARKVLLDSLDAEEFDKYLDGAAIDAPQNPELAKAFLHFRDWLSEYTAEKLSTFMYRLMNQAIVIRLEVSDAKDAFKLFETINNRGLRLNSADIIKNFLLGNAARFGDRHLFEARKTWSNIIQYLDGVSFDAFFRHFL
jgi:uncharacterized protein with ParB-like and HNH nuclease domain